MYNKYFCPLQPRGEGDGHGLRAQDLADGQGGVEGHNGQEVDQHAEGARDRDSSW